MSDMKGVRIFISATPELFIDYLKNKQFLSHVFNIKKPSTVTGNLYYCWSDAVIKDRIEYLMKNTSDKMLLFCNDKDKNKNLVSNYKGMAVSISSENKSRGESGKEFNNIRDRESLRDGTRLVASTTVLNNGINIKNDNIKHIFISDFYDVDDAIQCIGRKRFTSGEHINIYVKIPNHNNLSSELKRIKEELSIIDRLEKLSTYDFTKKYGRKNNRIVYVVSDEEGNMSWAVNEVLKTKLDHQLLFITKVLSDYKEYIKEITQKLGYNIEKKECIEPNQSDKLKEELIEVLSEYEGRKIYSNKNTAEKSAIIAFVEEINKCEHFSEKIAWRETPDSRRIETLISFLGLPFSFTRGKEKTRNGHRDETYWLIEKN